MSLNMSSAGAAQTTAGKWLPLLSMCGDKWKRIGDMEFETADEAVDFAEEVVRDLIDIMGGKLISTGPDEYHDCVGGKLPAPMKFQPELN